MSYEVRVKGRVPVKSWTRGVQFEDQARAQLENCASLPFVHHHIAAMPDVHWGMGAAVGSVIPTVGAIIPAAVGVDIGCGMIAAKTNLSATDLPNNLAAVRSAIEQAIPHGRTANGGPADEGAWDRSAIPEPTRKAWGSLAKDLERIVEKHPQVAKANHVSHLGTLGTGNHFVEVCLDEADRVWVMLHSGSRGIGNRIGTHFIRLAKKEMERWFLRLPDADLAYLPEGSDYFDDYVGAVHWAQRYAETNRELMMQAALAALANSLARPVEAATEVVNCHHNYVAQENHFGKNVWLTRKGAVRARQGDLGIIPGSMGARSYIVRGKGNADSFHSCSHGAGRAMSRRQAKERFSLEDHAKATEGVECRKDEGVLDETPGAYKSIDAVMAAQADLVDVVHTLRQILCVKG